MRDVRGLVLFALQVISYLSNASAQTPNSVYISPNAQTGLVSDILYNVTQGILLLTPNQSLVFDFNGAYISELSTIRISSGGFTWTNFTGFGTTNYGNSGPYAVFAYVDKTRIIMGGGDWMRPLAVYSVAISGIRCNVAPLTHGTNPGNSLTVTVRLKYTGGESTLSQIDVATFADPIDSHLLAGLAYTWSNGLWHATATIRLSEAGAFSNAFETQSIGSPDDATQLIITLWGMPNGMLLKNAVVANTTSATVSTAISPTAVFPMSGWPIRIPVNIFGQSAKKVENIDIYAAS